MPLEIEVAAGSIQGTLHRAKSANNQDSYSLFHDDDVIVAVVCDGCGSTPHAEVGAQLGSQIIARQLVHHIRDLGNNGGSIENTEEILAYTHLTTSLTMWNMADKLQLDATLIQGILDYLLFTVVGCVITEEAATFFSIGDGMVAINGQVTQLGPFPDNAPPFIGYSLLNDSAHPFGDEVKRFNILAHLPTLELQSFMIGCDGVAYIAEAAEKLIPGTNQPVGELAQFWTDDHYFRNSVNVQRKLNMINREVNRIDPQTGVFLGKDHGLLPDDTTMIVGRRKA